MITDQITYSGYRYAPEIISQAVWLYHRFCLSFRDLEDLLAELCQAIMLFRWSARSQENQMIKCHLSRLMGERRIKIAELARDTGINRGTLTWLFHEQATRIDLDVIDYPCAYFGCEVGDLFEHQDDA